MQVKAETEDTFQEPVSSRRSILKSSKASERRPAASQAAAAHVDEVFGSPAKKVRAERLGALRPPRLSKVADGTV